MLRKPISGSPGAELIAPTTSPQERKARYVDDANRDSFARGSTTVKPMASEPSLLTREHDTSATSADEMMNNMVLSKKPTRTQRPFSSGDAVTAVGGSLEDEDEHGTMHPRGARSVSPGIRRRNGFGNGTGLSLPPSPLHSLPLSLFCPLPFPPGRPHVRPRSQLRYPTNPLNKCAVRYISMR